MNMEALVIEPRTKSEARLVKENPDNISSFFLEEGLISHEDFRKHFEKRAYERLGIKLDLSPSNLASFE